MSDPKDQKQQPRTQKYEGQRKQTFSYLLEVNNLLHVVFIIIDEFKK